MENRLTARAVAVVELSTEELAQRILAKMDDGGFMTVTLLEDEGIT